MKVTFNTGRLYTEEGQVIAAEIVGNVINFQDHSRCIIGQIIPNPRELEDARLVDTMLIRLVMRYYDHNKYGMRCEGVARSEKIINYRI